MDSLVNNARFLREGACSTEDLGKTLSTSPLNAGARLVSCTSKQTHPKEYISPSVVHLPESITSGAVQRTAPSRIVVTPMVDIPASMRIERPKSAICTCSLSSSKMLAFKRCQCSLRIISSCLLLESRHVQHPDCGGTEGRS